MTAIIKADPGWQLPEGCVTAESVATRRPRPGCTLTRRALLASGTSLAITTTLTGHTRAATYPAPRNSEYTVSRPITDEAEASEYNNFYEFGSSKYIQKKAKDLPLSPWHVTFDGLVEKAVTYDMDQILKAMTLEERVYRFRCVEAWAMVVPWTGFPLKALLALAKPLSSARFVRFETFLKPAIATGQQQIWYPWPYVEGITVDEAENDLAFMATGIYGKPLPHQFGAPIRLVLPWKYGFKSSKSIVQITFTEQQPVSFWEKVMPREYGFWANVNPEVAHPRWSQATERLLGSTKRIPTLLYNGYGDHVAHLYGRDAGERFFR